VKAIDAQGNRTNSIIKGTAGNDTITGGAGNDTITGGAGSDTFVYGATSGTGLGNDTITDWATGDNKLDLKDLITDTTKIASELVTDGAIVITGSNSNADTVITVAHAGTGGSADTVITLTGVAFTSQAATIAALGDDLSLSAVPVLAETSSGSSLVGRAIVVTDTDGYDGLSVVFSATDSTQATFNIPTSGSGGTAILYNVTDKTVSYGGTVVGTTVLPVFDNIRNITIDGSSLEKTAGKDVWTDANPNASTGFTGDGYLSAQAGVTGKTVFFGLSSVNANNSGEDESNGIEYAIAAQEDGKYLVLEVPDKNGKTFDTKFTSTMDYTTTDVFTIKKTGTKIEYLKNNAVFYTSEKTSETTDTLYFDSIFYSKGAKLTDIEMSQDDFNITFNSVASKTAVNTIINAVTNESTTTQVITVSATDVQGNKSGNIIKGTAENDTIVGSDKNDTIKGGAGNDTITGGAGDDTFVYGVASDTGLGNDTITDWATGNNKLNLKDLITDTTKSATELVTDSAIVITGTSSNADT
ncbi:MAG: hypothetical protein FE834_10660, partial [Gammaproteobacteria bacterium]|nr:hypothetical protein [Gammaproteobacteria bacterium]